LFGFIARVSVLTATGVIPFTARIITFVAPITYAFARTITRAGPFTGAIVCASTSTIAGSNTFSTASFGSLGGFGGKATGR
jgi:hypothetical protein